MKKQVEASTGMLRAELRAPPRLSRRGRNPFEICRVYHSGMGMGKPLLGAIIVLCVRVLECVLARGWAMPSPLLGNPFVWQGMTGDALVLSTGAGGFPLLASQARSVIKHASKNPYLGEERLFRRSTRRCVTANK